MSIFSSSTLYSCKDSLTNVIEEYKVSRALISIGFSRTNDVVYCVSEPAIPEAVMQEIDKIIEVLIRNGFKSIPDSVIFEKIVRKHRFNKQVLQYYDDVSYYIDKILSGYKSIYVLMEDPKVEEIAYTRPDQPVSIIHRDFPVGWIKTNIQLNSDEVDDLIISLARKSGKAINIAHPYVEGILPDGHRVALTYSREISRHGSTFVIRKHLMKPLTISQLISMNVLNKIAAAYLWQILEMKRNIIIVGPTASGKTTLLQALLLLIPPYKRVVTIEDTPELNLAYHPQWDSLITRHTYIPGEGEDIDLYKLAKFSLRRRADYFVIGEIRGEEARLIPYAATSGHGVLATFHAEDSYSAILRLKSHPFNLNMSQLASISVIVVLSMVTTPEGIERRRVTEIAEIIQSDDSSIRLHKVFAYDNSLDSLIPASTNEVISNSIILENESKKHGTPSIRNCIEEKLSILHQLQHITSYEEFYSILTEYYLAKLQRKTLHLAGVKSAF